MDYPRPSLEELLDGFSDPAVVIDLDYRIVAANRAYRSRYGRFDSEALPYCYQISHHFNRPCDEAGETCPLKNSLASGQPQRVLHLHFTSQGEEHVDVQTLPIRDEQGEIRYFLEILEQSEVAQHQASQPLGMVGWSPAFTRMLGLVERVAPTDTAVLLLGESGTGKELLAQALHDTSRRAQGPFVPVDCSGLSESLFESELFGYEKGAFTGAQSRKIGLVEAAQGGTLFLDELGDIPLALQVKLLRLLETATFRRVGGVEPQLADFRLVCATHRDLKQMVAEGRFRQDLYYRISAFPIHVPSLRERPQDLVPLVEALLQRLTPERRLTVSTAAMQCLAGYDFPGNIRELRNILERASLLADGDEILPEHLPSECAPRKPQVGLPPFDKVVPLKQLEQDYLRWAAAQHRGDKRQLAEQLGLTERTLYRRLQALKVE